MITGVGKFFSNGLDLDWLSQQLPDVVLTFFDMMKRMQIQLGTFPIPTIAAINGTCSLFISFFIFPVAMHSIKILGSQTWEGGREGEEGRGGSKHFTGENLWEGLF